MNNHGIILRTGSTEIGFAPGFNVAPAFIDRHLREGRGSKAAIRTAGGETVTYAEVADRCGRAGSVLLAAGLRPGDRVLMIVKDCPAFFYAFWGAIRTGIVPVPLNTLLRAPDYAYIVEDSGAAVVLYSSEFAAEVEPGLAQSGHKPRLVLRAEGHGDTLLSRLQQADPSPALVPSSADADCFWLYSSGSTGRPKGAVHAHRDMVAASELYGVRTLGVRENDVCFSAAKLFFAYGLGNAMTFPLWTGATAILDDRRPTPDTTFEVMERLRPTLYFGVPTLYAAQLQALEQRKPDVSSLRACVSAGEALPPDLFRRWFERTGTRILDGIGSTEALHIFLSNRLDDFSPGSSGRAVPGYEARIVDDAGKPVAQGTSGRLWIRGPSTAKYYWNKPEKSAETMVGGWLDTGDTYRQDEAGYYVYEGRSDDMLKVGGIWCSPVEIEACLIAHPAVLEAAVVGNADADGLIKPKAFVVLKQASDAGEAMSTTLAGHCRATLAPYKYPRWFEYVTELPKTATGKIQRFKLRA